MIKSSVAYHIHDYKQKYKNNSGICKNKQQYDISMTNKRPWLPQKMSTVQGVVIMWTV